MVNKSLPASRAGFEKSRTREWWGLSFERSADASCEVQRAGIVCRGCVATAEFHSVHWSVGVGLRHQVERGDICVRPEGCVAVSYTHLRAHETVLDLVCRL